MSLTGSETSVRPGDSQPPIVFAVCVAICQQHGSNPFRKPYGEIQSEWPMWMDHIREARAVLDRTAIMLRAVGHSDAAEHIRSELASSAY